MLANSLELGARSKEVGNGGAVLSKLLMLIPGIEQLLKFGVLIRGHVRAFLASGGMTHNDRLLAEFGTGFVCLEALVQSKAL